MGKKKRVQKGKARMTPASPEPSSSSMASPGQAKALATFDILENILQCVDMKTLLISCQRVCTSWRDAIANSARLQQNLFFKSTPLDKLGVLPFPDTDATQGNTAGLSSDPDDSDGSDGSGESDEQHPISGDKLLLLLQNPLLRTHFGGFFSASGWSWSGRCDSCGTIEGSTLTTSFALYWGRSMFDFLTTREDPWRRKAFTRRGASWRTMLLAKFPITKVIFRTKFSVYRSQRGDTSRRNEDVLDFPNGLRMGQLFDLFFSMLYVEPVVGWHDAHVVWRIPRTHLGKPGCKCDEGGKRHEKKRTPSSTQSWDLLVDETYYHIAGPVRNEAGRRAARTQEQCKDKRACLGRVRKRTGPKWIFRSQDFVDGFAAFGTTLEDRTRLVEEELNRLSLGSDSVEG